VDLLVGAFVSAPLAVAANRVGRISGAGALSGVLCGALFYAAFFLAGLLVLGVGLSVTIAASKVGGATGSHVAVHEPRGAANIVANCGIGLIAAIAELMNLGLRTELTGLWAATAVAAGVSDTVASEIGKRFGGLPRSFPTWRRVTPGTAGAITAIGTLAGVAAAALVIAPAAMLWLFGWPALLCGVAGCVVGQVVESALATAIRRDSTVISHYLNVINTATASVTALGLVFYGWT
jgi:uncharacterized protein (TIGR00297 family)